MYHLIGKKVQYAGILDSEVVVPGRARVLVESVVAVFTSKAVAEAYVDEHGPTGNSEWDMGTGVLRGYSGWEIREIPVDPI